MPIPHLEDQHGRSLTSNVTRTPMKLKNELCQIKKYLLKLKNGQLTILGPTFWGGAKLAPPHSSFFGPGAIAHRLPISSHLLLPITVYSAQFLPIRHTVKSVVLYVVTFHCTVRPMYVSSSQYTLCPLSLPHNLRFVHYLSVTHNAHSLHYLPVPHTVQTVHSLSIPHIEQTFHFLSVTFTLQSVLSISGSHIVHCVHCLSVPSIYSLSTVFQYLTLYTLSTVCQYV